MNRRNLIVLALALTGAATAAALMIWVTPKKTVLAFIGWTIFFLAIHSPLFYSSSSQRKCGVWFERLMGNK